MHCLNTGWSQRYLANPLCPLFTLFQSLSPSLWAGDLTSKLAGKREATRLALPPYPALSPKVPSPLLLGGQRGSLPPWVQGPLPASPTLLRPFLVLFHTSPLLFQGHPECFTLAVSSSSAALALSQATPAWLSASLPTHWASLSLARGPSLALGAGQPLLACSPLFQDALWVLHLLSGCSPLASLRATRTRPLSAGVI